MKVYSRTIIQRISGCGKSSQYCTFKEFIVNPKDVDKLNYKLKVKFREDITLTNQSRQGELKVEENTIYSKIEI